jgi:PAS domain-containing protein
MLDYGNRQYSVCFVQDIAKRKRAKEDLRRLRNYLSNIIDSMPSVLVGVEPRKGYQDERPCHRRRRYRFVLRLHKYGSSVADA